MNAQRRQLPEQKWSPDEPMMPGQRRYAHRGAGFGVRKGSMQTGYTGKEEVEQPVDKCHLPAARGTSTGTSSCNYNISTHSANSASTIGLRHGGHYETVEGTDAFIPAAPSLGDMVSGLFVKRKESLDNSISDGPEHSKVAEEGHRRSKPNQNSSNSSSNNSSARLVLERKLSNLSRRLSSIGNRSKRSSMNSTLEDSNHNAGEEDWGQTLQDLSLKKKSEDQDHDHVVDGTNCQTGRRSFSEPGPSTHSHQSSLTSSSSHERRARRHSSASNHGDKQSLRSLLILDFAGKTDHSQRRLSLGSLRSSLGGSWHNSGRSVDSLGIPKQNSGRSIDSLGLPAEMGGATGSREEYQRRRSSLQSGRVQRRRSSLQSVSETKKQIYESNETADAIAALRRSSLQHTPSSPYS